jgi:hypothetical protein
MEKSEAMFPFSGEGQGENNHITHYSTAGESIEIWPFVFSGL